MRWYKYLFIFFLFLSVALIVSFLFERDVVNNSKEAFSEKKAPVVEIKDSKSEEETKDKIEENNGRLDQVNYKGELYRDAETHYYLFTTTKDGKIQVEWGENTIGSDFIITTQNWESVYYNGDLLPAGNYMFVITTNPAETSSDSNIVTYDFNVLGLTFCEPPDPTLPSLTVESPVEVVNRLGEGEHTVTFQGKTDGTEARFGKFTKSDLPDTVINNSFHEEISFTTSSPAYSAYRITVINKAGNRINRNYEFLYPSGKQE
ncbi:hypothetical protein JOC85_001743 [Bacillus mesophilus]|uniref:Uncharacterized protein n=1 Tax=Bacillus mesophilus TaxID=1808955 RepID=A0A6M0Q527_9BACI|nr:hypothetical protein [Bacillus mesophilus]MBM7660971.1 hypothetical protein [Bacillus mesophilus]NEY71487.1 hypothetical protein [Bacillus mesophilus]